MSYPPSQEIRYVQPVIDQPNILKQPALKPNMDIHATTERSSQVEETLRLRGGCPGRFCGLPILPCRCDICIIPIPCC
ncbi:uncharacterized protein L203_105373 [Cryptococcus depauperatus CBS 7841]|uniref:Uncharacterized protein n=1 Tax=Cryptococcus depauperatus CBS 7841 TaxID=1295531 RepID=A0AAJ8JXA1_9TREE